MKRLYDKALMDQIAKVYGNEVAFLSEFSKALLDIIREGLIRDGLVRLHQFGTFKLKWMKSRNGVNPSTGEKILIQARPRVIFTAAKALKERVEPNPPELQPFNPVEVMPLVDPVPLSISSVETKPEETVQQKLVDGLDSLQSNNSVDDLAVQLESVPKDELINENNEDLSDPNKDKGKLDSSELIDSSALDSELTDINETELSELDTSELDETGFKANEELTEKLDLSELDSVSNDEDQEDIKNIINKSDISDLTNSETFNELTENNKDSQPDEVIESIQDEIEILDQVVDVLKSENTDKLVDVLEDLDGDSNLGDPIDELAETISEISEEEPVVTKSDWLDNSIIDDIKEISELQYFKNSDTKIEESSVNDEVVANKVVEENLIEEVHSTNQKEEKVADIVAAKSDKYKTLDINLDALSDNTDIKSEKTNTKKSTRPWFAIAATIFVLIAAGVLFNALDITNSNTSSVDENTVASNQSPQYQFTYDENVAVKEEGMAVEPVTTVTQAIHVPVEIVNDKVELESLANETELNNNKALQANTNQSVTVTNEIESSIESESNSIIVSTEKYDELQRVSSEQSVYFSGVDHKLVNGDSLWRLAKRHYINPFYWPHIYQANRIKIVNPDKVKIGKVVELPTLYGHPNSLTQRDKHNIAIGYYHNYLYHKGKGNPYAYFSLIGVERFDASLLNEYKEEIERSDINNLALLTE